MKSTGDAIIPMYAADGGSHAWARTITDSNFFASSMATSSASSAQALKSVGTKIFWNMRKRLCDACATRKFAEKLGRCVRALRGGAIDSLRDGGEAKRERRAFADG